MKEKSLLSSISFSCSAFIPLIIISLLNIGTDLSLNGIPTILAFVVWSTIFYAVILNTSNLDQTLISKISIVHLILFIILRFIVQFLDTSLFILIMDVSISSWLLMLIKCKLHFLKSESNIIMSIAGLIYPYACILLCLPQIMNYLKTPGLPTNNLINYLSFEYLLLYLIGAIITLGTLSIANLKRNDMKFILVILHILMIMFVVDNVIMSIDSIFYNAYFVSFSVYKFILLGSVLSIVVNHFCKIKKVNKVL